MFGSGGGVRQMRGMLQTVVLRDERDCGTVWVIDDVKRQVSSHVWFGGSSCPR